MHFYRIKTRSTCTLDCLSIIFDELLDFFDRDFSGNLPDCSAFKRGRSYRLFTVVIFRRCHRRWMHDLRCNPDIILVDKICDFFQFI